MLWAPFEQCSEFDMAWYFESNLYISHCSEVHSLYIVETLVNLISINKNYACSPELALLLNVDVWTRNNDEKIQDSLEIFRYFVSIMGINFELSQSLMKYKIRYYIITLILIRYACNAIIAVTMTLFLPKFDYTTTFNIITGLQCA